MPIPQTLTHYLSQSSWQHLKALLAIHHLPRAAADAKATLIPVLSQHLVQPATLATMLTQVDAFGKDALRALLAADGALPVHTFAQRFGPIRPYRPWRKAETTTVPPWQAPISTTETLWYLGLIYCDPPKPQPGQVQHYVIPADLLPHLALHLAPAAVDPALRPQPQPGRLGTLERHLALWLATLHGPPTMVRPVAGRWLPPTLVATLCQRLGLDADPAFTPIRSERHHPYLAFLHYLALAADLIAVTPAAFQLTPTAWAWLAADTATRHQQLYQAWRDAPAALARPFDFPWETLTPAARADLLPHLARLCEQPPQPLSVLVDHWRLHDHLGRLPASRPVTWYADETEPLHDPLLALCTGPLHWLNLIDLLQAPPALVPAPTFCTIQAQWGPWLLGLPNATAPVCPPPALCTMPKQPGDTILAPLQVQPVHLVHLARFCDWTISPPPTPTPHTFTLAPARIAHLAAGGILPDHLLVHLQAALGRLPSRRTCQRVRAWAQPGQQLRLRPLLVLEADSAERLADLRRHKLVRNRLGEIIAPTRVTINPAAAAALVQTLRTLGYYVEPPAPLSSTGSGPGTATPLLPPPPELVEGELVEGELVEGESLDGGLTPTLQWFLLTLYTGLGAHVALPLDMPWAVRQALRRQLTVLQQATAESAATQLLDQLQTVLNGYWRLPTFHLPVNADPEPTIRAALAKGQDLEIRYRGSSDDKATTRTVTPYWIEERHGARYLIAWCHYRQDERIFRLDRIEAVTTF